jgi:O-antigen/teichoic acid export membrane protein
MASIEEELEQPSRPGFLSSAVQTFGAQIAVAVISLGNALVVSRALGPSGRGDVVFLTTIAYIVSSLATVGVQEANVNLAGAQPGLRRALATNSILLSALFGCLAIAAVTALVILVPAAGGAAKTSLLALTLASLPGLVLSTNLRFLIQGDYGFAVTNFVWVLPAVLNISINGIFALLGALTVGVAVVTWIGGQLIGTAILVWYVARRSVGFGRPSLSLARGALGFGVRSHIGRVMLLGNYRLDQWILGAIAGARELGLYSVAVAFAEALFLLPTALSAVQRPDLVRASHAEAVRRTALIFRGALVVTLLAAAALVILAPLLVVHLFGEDFRGSIDDLRVLTIGAFGIVALKQIGNALTARRLPTRASFGIGMAFVTTIVLDVLLIPSLGGLGAALASSLSYTLGGIVILILFTRALGGHLLDFVPRPRDVAEVWRRFRSRSRPGTGAATLASTSEQGKGS